MAFGKISRQQGYFPQLPKVPGKTIKPWYYRPGVGLLSQYSPFRYFRNFQIDQNTRYLYDITFIFNRCQRSWAAETPDKYERDWDYI